MIFMCKGCLPPVMDELLAKHTDAEKLTHVNEYIQNFLL